MSPREPFLCAGCQRFDFLDGAKCEAFSDGIPPAILSGASHFDPVPGDGGVVFLGMEGENPWLAAYLAYWYRVETEA